MAVKNVAAALVTTAATGQKRGGDGVSQVALAKRIRLGRHLVRKGVRLNVQLDADGSAAYKRMLKASRRALPVARRVARADETAAASPECTFPSRSHSGAA